MSAMATMRIEPGGGDSQRNRFDFFEERTTRPEHMKDKRGTICFGGKNFFLNCLCYM